LCIRQSECIKKILQEPKNRFEAKLTTPNKALPRKPELRVHTFRDCRVQHRIKKSCHK